ATSWSTAASSCRAAARSCWPTPKYAAPTSAPEGGRGVIAGAPPRPGFSYTQTGILSNRRSTRPGCEGALACHPFRTEGGAPTPKPGFSYIKTGGPSRTVGAPAPGAKVLWLDTLFAPGAVLLHPNRGSPTPKPGSSRTVGAPAPGAKVLWLDSLFAPRAVLLHPNRNSPRTVGAPAPGAKGFGPG